MLKWKPIPYLLHIFHIKFTTGRKLALTAQLIFRLATTARSLCLAYRNLQTPQISQVITIHLQGNAASKNTNFEIFTIDFSAVTIECRQPLMKFTLEKNNTEMRGSKRKGRKRKQLRLQKWGISMQGELYLEVPCQIKNVFSKPFFT